MAFASSAAVAGPRTRRCKITIILRETTGNMASTPLPAGPILKLKTTTAPTSSVTVAARTAKAYQGWIVGVIRTWRNGSTMIAHDARTATLRTDADQAVQWTGVDATAVASHAASAKDTLIHRERRCANRA